MSDNNEKLGAVWELSFENSSKPKYNVLIDPEKVSVLGVNGRDEIKLRFVRNDEKKDDKSPTHYVFANNYKTGQEKNNSDVLYVNVNKKDVESISVGDSGKKALEVCPKKVESVGRDRANYFVRATMEDGEKKYVGRAWTPSQIVESKVYVGNAFRKDFDDGGKAYNIFLKRDEIEKMSADSYGNIRLSVASKKNPGGGPSHSVYQSIGKEPYNEISLSLNRDKILGLPVNDKGYVSITAVDKLNISKDKADLVVYENTGKPEKEKNIVGSGWTNMPDMIRLQKEDKTPDGLLRAIVNNHLVKVQAILSAAPSVVQKKHVNMIGELQEKGERIEKGMSSIVMSAYDEKQSQKNGMKM